MKEPFVPKSTVSEMLPLKMRQEFFQRIATLRSSPHSRWLKYYRDFQDEACKIPSARWPVHVPAEKGK